MRRLSEQMNLSGSIRLLGSDVDDNVWCIFFQTVRSPAQAMAML